MVEEEDLQNGARKNEKVMGNWKRLYHVKPISIRKGKFDEI